MVPLFLSHSGHASLPTSSRSLTLRDVLVTPRIVKNLISVRQFTIDDNCSVEFDPWGFSVKDLRTRAVILRCSSSGDLYPVTSLPHALTALTADSTLWHRRLGHPGLDAFRRLVSSSSLPINKVLKDPSLCHACQLGRHVRLPFSASTTRTHRPFELIHCDLWTSPIECVSGYKYFLVILDDFTHYLWTYPLRQKSEAFSLLSNFRAYVATEFSLSLQAIQCDNGREFDNRALQELSVKHGILLRFSCPYTSPQNGKAERIIRTVNDIVRTLLFQASMPPKYWVEALHAATYLLNRLPTKALAAPCPFFALFSKPPDYTLLRTFGCLCYPNLSATMPHKLSHRSTACVFLGYPSNHRGYRCMDLESRRIIISRHVIFDETRFPFAPDFSVSNLQQPSSPPPPDDDPIDVLTPVPVPPMHVGPCRSAGTRRSPGPRPASPAPAPSTPCTPVHAPAASAHSSPVTLAHALVPSACSPASLARHTPAHAASPTLASPSDASNDAASGSASPASSSTTATPQPSPPPSVRQMVTRRQAGKIGPRERLNLHVAPIAAPSPVPKSVRGALKDPNWLAAMTDEYGALLANNTWDLVRPPANANVVSGKWVFRHKFKPDGSLDRYKARWVLRGFSQEHGIDFDETFSLVVKPATIRLSSPSLSPPTGRFASSTSRTPFSMGISTRWSFAISPLASSTLLALTMCAASTAHSTV